MSSFSFSFYILKLLYEFCLSFHIFSQTSLLASINSFYCNMTLLLNFLSSSWMIVFCVGFTTRKIEFVMKMRIIQRMLVPFLYLKMIEES